MNPCDRIRLAALAILGAISIVGLVAGTWLLAIGVAPEAAAAVMAPSASAGGAVAGALTLGRSSAE